jgi:hypothetical protein
MPAAEPRFRLTADGKHMLDTVEARVALFTMPDVAAGAVRRCNQLDDYARYFTWKRLDKAPSYAELDHRQRNKSWRP